MKKKFVMGVAFFIFCVTIFSVVGCGQSVPNKNSQAVTFTQANSAEVHIINNIEEAGLGPLTQKNVSIGGIHLGDSPKQVLMLYGEPSKKTTLKGNYPAPEWQYEKLGLSVLFTLSDKSVYSIDIYSPSNLRTNAGIGIDNSLEDIIRGYGQVYGYKPDKRTNNQIIFVTGSKRPPFTGAPYPTLTINLKNGRVSQIGLYTPTLNQ